MMMSFFILKPDKTTLATFWHKIQVKISHNFSLPLKRRMRWFFCEESREQRWSNKTISPFQFTWQSFTPFMKGMMMIFNHKIQSPSAQNCCLYKSGQKREKHFERWQKEAMLFNLPGIIALCPEEGLVMAWFYITTNSYSNSKLHRHWIELFGDNIFFFVWHNRKQ